MVSRAVQKFLSLYLSVHALDSRTTIASVVSGLVDIWLSVLQVDGGVEIHF